jgi:PAS domain S-box-containing protein
MNIRNKINFSFLGTFIIISIFIGIIVGLYTTNLIKQSAFSYLHSSNRARAEHIITFLQNQKDSTEILAGTLSVENYLKLKNTDVKYFNDRDDLIECFREIIKDNTSMYEIFVLDLNGKIVISTDNSKLGEDKSEDVYFINGKKDTNIKDIYYDESIKKINYTISSPIMDDETGNFLGVLVVRYDPKNFYSVVKSENGLGNTEENFLINKDKFFITPSIFLNDKEIILKEKVETQNAENCFDPREVEYVKKNGYSKITDTIGSQIVESKDYRGVDVIGTHSYIPETGWCLITKVDKSNLMSPNTQLFWMLLLILTLSLLFFIITGLLISKKITNPIKLLKIGVDKIRRGDLDYLIKVDSKDELGDLSTVFNEMLLSTKESKKNVDIKVGEQTREILNKTNDLENQKSAILNILEDVEKEKNKVENLASDLEKFKLAVENVSDQIVITDPEGIVVYGNRAVEIITGFKPEEAIGKKAGVLWKMPMPDEYYKNLWDTIKNKKKVFVDDIQNKRKNGDLYIANISISPVLNDKKDIIYFVAIEHDITKEKEIDKAKTEFVSLASHQLRTPLSSINWYTEMLLAGDAGPINEDQKKYLEEVAIGNKRMVDLVDSLLNVSRLDLGTFIIETEKIDIVEMSKSVVGELKPQIINRKLKLEEIYDNNIKDFEADRKLLRMVFQNLLSNAVKYTKEEGFIKVDISIFSKDQIFGDKKIEEESLGILIQDSGIGIPLIQQEKMFSKLFRADNARESETEGTGLGLYIIKSIVDQSGGEIWFKSEENVGTTFYVIFPKMGMKKKEGSRKLD